MALLKPALDKVTPEECVAALRDDFSAPGRFVMVSGNAKIEGDASVKRKFKIYPIGYFHIDLAEVQTLTASSISLEVSNSRSGMWQQACIVDLRGGRLFMIPPGAEVNTEDNNNQCGIG